MYMLQPSRDKNCLTSGESLDGIPTHYLVNLLKGVVQSGVGVARNVTAFGTRPPGPATSNPPAGEPQGSPLAPAFD